MVGVSKERDKSIDILRGFAMILVVFGHTLSGSAANSQDTMLYNVIWAIQMPLFILISGYVTKYSEPIGTFSALINYIKRRTVAYLLPWIVWTVLIKGILCGQRNFLNIKWLFWNMDSGYWFLFSIWSICILFGIAQYLSSLVPQLSHKFIRTIALLAFCVLGEAIILVIGLNMGLDFAAIKLTAYYFPFFVVGYLYGAVHDEIVGRKWFNTSRDLFLFIGLFGFALLLTNYNFFRIADNIYGVALRISASLLGCILVAILLPSVIEKSKKASDVFAWVGTHTIEIYVVHYLFLNMLHMSETSEISSVQGLLLVLINYALTFTLTTIAISILSNSKVCGVVLFGKYSFKR